MTKLESYIFEWLSMLLRWLHVITAIAWIGASFYFVWLDNHLELPMTSELKAKGVDGELWAVHGGGFYNPQKYLKAPPALPEKLHWFYWESYSTWISGFALFFLVYLWQPSVYLIDPQVLRLSPGLAVIAALAFIIFGWIGYDAICRVFGFRDRLVGIATAAWVIAATTASTYIFAGRAAFLITGAMLATIMTANVLFWIIPGQRKVVAAMKAGLPVDPVHGQRGKSRSVHNTYFTLPVLFCMLSNHYSQMYQHYAKALVLLLMMLAGALIRHYFVLRHKGQGNFWFPATAMFIFSGIFAWIAPATSQIQQNDQASQITTEQVFAIVKQRCYGCHAATPTLIGGGAPKNLAFEALEDLEHHDKAVYTQVVLLKNMPLGNLTQMTETERQSISTWFQSRSGK